MGRETGGGKERSEATGRWGTRVGGSRRQEKEVVEMEGGKPCGGAGGVGQGDKRGEQAAEGRVAGDGRGGGACKTEA